MKYFKKNNFKLLDIFTKMAPVKDIRMVKNKNTGQMRDFAFIEFYTIDVFIFIFVLISEVNLHFDSFRKLKLF